MVIECIPNISEGRRLDVIAALAAAVAATPGVKLLDRTSDPSHHRTVFTMAGDPAGLRKAVVALVEGAIAAIDLHQHRGVHPRIGAVDVVPFVPLAGATMADCVELAKAVGAELAERFALPIYLYEHAAASPDRRRLEQLRRGQFEGLTAKMRDAAWHPDYGPHHPHPTAGATVVGARTLLVAWNINLASTRLDVAKVIARTIRESSGGLPCVKALGVPLPHRDLVQVSMNLTDFTVTPIQRVFDAVRAEAARHGVEVLESELIGLIPAAALAETSPDALRFANFRDDRILEEQLRLHGLTADPATLPR